MTRAEKRAAIEAEHAKTIRDGILDMLDGRPVDEEVLEAWVAKALAKIRSVVDEDLAILDPSSRH